MKAIDFRNATFADLQDRLHGLRLTVLTNLRAQGPATTRQLAERSGIDILSVRPRITELMTLGFVCLEDGSEHAREGVYRALTDAEAEAALLNKQAAPIQAQPELKL
jgi:predicted transcriptional regulator